MIPRDPRAQAESGCTQRILMIHRYFWPDSPPYASLLRSIGEHLAGDGHHVTVFSTQPSYKIEITNPKRPYREMLGPFEVRRCRLLPERSRATWLRGLNSVFFAWKIFWHLLVHGGRYDVVMCSTVPPVITGAATRLGSRLHGCRFVYHAMDIWPEVANITGQMGSGWLYRLLRTLDTWNCRSAAAVVCLSNDMRRTYLARDSRLGSNVHIIGNFELPSYETAISPVDLEELKKPTGKFRVLFAGNLGRYQGLDDVVRAASLVDDSRIQFAIMGTGAMQDSLIQQAERAGCLGKSLVFLPHQSVEVAKALMRDADVSLVTLAPGVSSVAYPSKTLTLMAMGCPLGVMMEMDSELSQTIRQHGLGFAVECGDAPAMAHAVSQLAQSPDEIVAMGERVRAYAQSHAVAEAVLPRWGELMTSLSGERPLKDTALANQSFQSNQELHFEKETTAP